MAAKWGHAAEEHPEHWDGDFTTREEAIADGGALYDKPFYIMCGSEADGASYMPDAEQLLDRAAEQAYDAAGEAAEDFPDVYPEAIVELDALLQQWATKHLFAKFWIGDGKAELIDLMSDKGSTDGGSGQSPTLRAIPVGAAMCDPPARHRWREGGAIVLAADDCRVCLGSGDTDPSDAGRGACPACDGTGKRRHT